MKTVTATPLHSTKLLDRVKKAIRYKQYSVSAEQVYVRSCRSYIRFHQLRHPKDMGAVEVAAFLSYLANEKAVSASTHKKALAALLFLYKHVLRIDLPWLNEALNLRVKDFDFPNQTITVREGKGKKDRSLMLPVALLDLLNAVGVCQ